MARYFFHVRDGDKMIPDPEGVELRSHDSAVDECRSIVREVLNEEAFQTELAVDRRFEITDEQDHLVLIIPFLAELLD